MPEKKLIIVESPTKAKTISRFLGKGFDVQSSYGHIRDLPKSKLGVDVEHGFEPQYVVPVKSKKTVTALKKSAAKASAIYFATDEDREGEAISFHLAELLDQPKDKLKRIVFHEITKEAIDAALKNPRELDLRLVDAQQARRILDRLVGYELSPLLWKKVAKGLSAGRVQSVAVRLIVEREREIEAFKPQEYWSLEADFANTANAVFSTKLAKHGGQSIDRLDLTSKKDVDAILNDLKGASYSIADVQKKEVRKNPYPPYTTSTLQQDANRKLGFSSRQTMTLAQQLYEGIELGDHGQVGLITYMRTDSFNLAAKFLGEVGSFITESFGQTYHESRTYQTKSKGAQEAHEAIRPTDPRLTPEAVKAHLDDRQLKLYDLIWRRAVASQMSPAEMDSTSVDITNNTKETSKTYLFRANGQVTKFDGFLKVATESVKESELPELTSGEHVELKELKPNQHFTEPPARYSEAGLVKKLEEFGIGRPSTYAPTIATVIDRGYVERFERRLKPTDIALIVNDLLVKHFPEIVDYEFTANMEKQLDDVAEGTIEWRPVIKAFYDPFKKNLAVKESELDRKELTEQATEHICDKCGNPMVIKYGRFGKFLACTGYPDCKNTKELNQDNSISDAPAAEGTGEKCPVCKEGEVVMKRGRFGPFLGCNRYPDCKFIKNIEKKTGVTCPQCGQGDIIEKRSRFGKTFYSCNRYPDCKFALWSKPTGEKCPESGDLLVLGPKGTVRCSNKTCKYTKTLDETVTGEQVPPEEPAS
ncbi:MAG: type I DNA topoisomerase [Candidatus Kerfeldbacteria bacterium]|nr:type I DNA topoisomerase [Candidatus Kerfeldbacteria bacterium]